MTTVFAVVCRVVSCRLFIRYVSMPLYSLFLLPLPKYTQVKYINFSLFWKNGKDYHYANHCVYVFPVVIPKTWNSNCAANLWTIEKIYVSPPKNLTAWGFKSRNFLCRCLSLNTEGSTKILMVGFANAFQSSQCLCLCACSCQSVCSMIVMTMSDQLKTFSERP